MFNINYLKFFVLLSFISLLAVPLYLGLHLTPAFRQLIVNNTQNEAVRVANHLASMYFHNSPLLVDADTISHLAEDSGRITENFDLKKLKIFDSGGRIVFSTEAADIGKINGENYFHDIVARGHLFSKVVRKDEPSLEGQFLHTDVVETYVPLMGDGNFKGAFEIYFDITKEDARLNKLVLHVYGVIVVVSGILLPVIMLTYSRAMKHHTQCRILEQKLHHAAIRDELTGLLNRRGFVTMAEQQIKISRRLGRDLYLLFADMDNMKWINDNLGHEQGDQAIRETAEVIKNTYRESDIVSRFGGDEFAALLTCTPQVHEKEQILHRLQANLDAANARPGRGYQLQLSAGVVKCDIASDCSLEKMMREADALMYEHKTRRKASGPGDEKAPGAPDTMPRLPN
jgi:diguanylate cyclase (GGDEF)-like protein